MQWRKPIRKDKPYKKRQTLWEWELSIKTLAAIDWVFNYFLWIHHYVSWSSHVAIQRWHSWMNLIHLYFGKGDGRSERWRKFDFLLGVQLFGVLSAWGIFSSMDGMVCVQFLISILDYLFFEVLLWISYLGSEWKTWWFDSLDVPRRWPYCLWGLAKN